MNGDVKFYVETLPQSLACLIANETRRYFGAMKDSPWDLLYYPLSIILFSPIPFCLLVGLLQSADKGRVWVEDGIKDRSKGKTLSRNLEMKYLEYF